jgi:hypothetical protein
MGRRIVAYRHWFASRQWWARRQGGHHQRPRRLRKALRLAQAGAKLHQPLADGSAGAPNPGTSCEEARPETQEARHDPAAPRWKEPNAWMDTAGVERTRRGGLGGGDPGPTPTRARRRGEQKEVSIGTN